MDTLYEKVLYELFRIITVDENYYQSPAKRGRLKSLTRKRAAQDDSRMAKKHKAPEALDSAPAPEKRSRRDGKTAAGPNQPTIIYNTL